METGAIGIITTNYTTAHPSVLTAARPTAAVSIAGRYRMVDFPLSMMSNAGIRTIGLILPTKYRSIIDHVSAGKEWSLDRKNGGLFMMPGSSFGSTRFGGRFLIRDLIDNRALLRKAHEKYVVLSAANIVMNVDINNLVDRHIDSGADITMVCKKATTKNRAVMGLSVEKGRITNVKFGIEPGDIAFLDMCVMEIERLESLLNWYSAEDYMDLFEALGEDLGRYKVLPYDYEGPAIPVFSLGQYYQASMRFLDPDLISAIFSADQPIHTKVHDIPPAKYEPGASVSNSLVSAGCRIAGTLEDSILGRSVTVEKGAVVKNSIIIQSCNIGAGAVIENCIIDKYNDIPANTVLKGSPDDVFIQPKGIFHG